MSGVIKKNGKATTNRRNTSLAYSHPASTFLSYANGITWIILFALIGTQKYIISSGCFDITAWKKWMWAWWKEEISNINTAKWNICGHDYFRYSYGICDKNVVSARLSFLMNYVWVVIREWQASRSSYVFILGKECVSLTYICLFIYLFILLSRVQSAPMA